MSKEFLDIYNKIKEYDTIIIHRHIRPDGDAIGSQLGLKYAILNNFPNKHVYAVGEKAPEYLKKIAEYDEISDDTYKGALAICVDTSNEDRVSDNRFKFADYIIKIDHHDDSPDYGNINFVQPEVPACASIVTSMIRSFPDFELSNKAAYYLFFGIVSDTGRFRYRGVDTEVFENAAFLMKYDIDPQEMYDQMYIDDAKVLKLNGYVYSHFKLTENGVAYIHFTKRMMKKYGVSKDDAGNLVNTLSGLEGSLIWVAFIDQMLKPGIDPKNGMPLEKETRARVRSRHVAINEVCGKYHGGGHLSAAGATVYSKKEKKALLNDLDATLKQYKEEHPDAF